MSPLAGSHVDSMSKLRQDGLTRRACSPRYSIGQLNVKNVVRNMVDSDHNRYHSVLDCRVDSRSHNDSIQQLNYWTSLVQSMVDSDHNRYRQGLHYPKRASLQGKRPSQNDYSSLVHIAV